MGIIKLVEAGDSLTAIVTKAERVKGNYGEQVRFTMTDGDLYVPLDSALRQLERIPLDIEGCVGEMLTFSRDPNSKPGSKPYWGIRVANAAERSTPTQSKRLPPPKRVIPGLDDLPEAGLGAMDAVSYQRQAPPPSDDDAPEWVTGDITAPPSVAPNAEKKKAYINAYIDLLGYVRAHSGLKDEVAIQAATATLHIGLKQEGLR
jgi:hypothetical protein